MNECGKACARRMHTPAFTSNYFVGSGIDVGSGDDPLSRWLYLFPLATDCRNWDRSDGDAATLPGVAPKSYDWLHSSHCLEHLDRPVAALSRWLEVVRYGGHLVILVPHWGMYEGYRPLPSRFNGDHKGVYDWHLPDTRGGTSVKMLLDVVYDQADLVYYNLLGTTFNPHVPETVDQTMNPVAECAIEFVLMRRWPNSVRQRNPTR